MELMVVAALLVLFGAWWLVRAGTARTSSETAREQTTPERGFTPPTLLRESASESLAPQDTTAPAVSRQASPFAEIVDPKGGVREISAEEVSACFRPVQTRLASLRKVAANATRVANAFERSGGPTPSVEKYRRAHTDAVVLTALTEGLLDTILFAAQADAKSYEGLLERVIDVEMKLEENLATIAHVESERALGRFRSV
jgi:cytoskeletal protein RodZ